MDAPVEPGPPPSQRPRSTAAVRRLVVLGAMLMATATALSTAFLPWLVVHHPALLVVLSADARNVVLAAPAVSLPVVLAIGVPRRALGMLVTYGLGMLYGRRVLSWSVRRFPRLGELAGWFEGLFGRHERKLIVLWPTYTTSAVAGVAGTDRRVFAPWMLVGQLGHVLVFYYLGAAVSVWTDRLVAFLARHVWESTASCVLVVATHRLVVILRRRRAARLQVAADVDAEGLGSVTSSTSGTASPGR